MKLCTFTFLDVSTGERRSATAISLNEAARAAGLDVPYRGKLPEPWYALECRNGQELIWSATLD